MKQYVYQNHHLVYKSDKNKEVTRKIRKGVHQALTLLCRNSFLTDEEIDCIMIECYLRRQYEKSV